MLRLLRISLALIVVTISLQLVLSVSLISKRSSSYGAPTDRSNELEESTNDDSMSYYSQLKLPRIGAYVKNYAGKVKRVIGQENGTDNVNIWTLPKLRVEDHIWEGKSITLDCISEDYPVYWEYRGLGSPKVRAMTARQAPEFYNTSSYSYEATVTFTSTNYRQTGEYTCRGVHHYGMGVSWPRAFLFVPGSKLFVASEEDDSGNNVTRSIRLNADENDSWMTLPCAPSDKEANVNLYLLSRGRLNSDKMTKVPLSSSLTFDPLEGFRLKWKGMTGMRNPWGNYVCVGENSKITNERLFLKVRGPNHSKRFTIYDETSGSLATFDEEEAQMSMKFNGKSQRIECCTKLSSAEGSPSSVGFKSQAPRMKLSTCISISDCLLASTSTSSPICNQGMGNCQSDAFMKRLNDSCVAYEIPHDIHESGVLDCTSDSTDNQLQMQFSYEPQHGLVTQFTPESVDPSQMLSLTREKSSGAGDVKPNEAVYFCNMNRFFFSDGLKWAIQKISQSNFQFITEDSFPSRPTLVVDETQVSKVYCFAPIWDSKTLWRNTSMNVPFPQSKQ